jgi:hypothetical protein
LAREPFGSLARSRRYAKSRTPQSSKYIFTQVDDLIMPDDIIKLILDDMNNQGFPLEVKVTETLKTHGWRVYNQQSYLDVETGKRRTIDIECIKDIESSEKEWAFQSRLIIECKKCAKPWVFYVSEAHKKDIADQLRINAQLYTDHEDQLLYPNSVIESARANLYFFDRELAKPFFDKLAYVTYEPFTKGKGNSIHRAIMQVISATIDLNRKLTQDKSVEIPHHIFFKPVIILDGQLYVYQDKTLKKEKGLYYLVSYDDSAFIVEVITVDYLETYLKGIDNNISDFHRSLANAPR